MPGYGQVWQQWPHNLKFRRSSKLRLRPVKGGRWSVRRSPRDVRLKPSTPQKRWRAWTQGAARRHNAMFETFDEAVHWAQFVAGCYEAYPPELANEVVRRRRSEMAFETRRRAAEAMKEIALREGIA